MALFLLLLFLSIAHDKCVSGKRLDMTPGNPPFQKTVNSSSAKASLAQDFVSQKRSLTDCAPMGMTSPPCPPCPLHPSFMSLGAFAPQPAASLASTVEWRARLWARPVGAFYPEPSTFLPCPAEAGRGPRVIARHYIDKICCPRYGHLAGRSLRAGGRHATCKLFEGDSCRKAAEGGRWCRPWEEGAAVSQ